MNYLFITRLLKILMRGKAIQRQAWLRNYALLVLLANSITTNLSLDEVGGIMFALI